MSWPLAWNVQGIGPVAVHVPAPPMPPRPRPDTPIRIDRYLALPYSLFQDAIDALHCVGVELTHDQAVAFLAKEQRGAHILYFDEVETQLRERLCEEFVEELFKPRRPPSPDDPDAQRKIWAEALVAGYDLSEYALAKLRRPSV